ncbi:hypothetical protein JN11_02919 [Mucilaginibacter frigoritolerans]|jgi:hypothetical protein|uniref:Uncharacterized protein n=1 Tax=Mucilaginibacter frigoritolerans TaxID=652788 RepID=A0A562TYP0_9SPHI|nr:hypothetical protein [Mucilaginibacter frigoritolerans]TWI98731.1 hypothetical protein JN11_02919 [Mucilaginibacter frigoritolerans]
MKFISPTIHGLIDYLVVVFLLTSPATFGFTGLLAGFTYVIGIIHLLLTICTEYKLGIFKFIPLTIHSGIELMMGVLLIVIAYTLFSNNSEGKLFYVIFGTVILLTWLFTDYKGIHHKKVETT